MPTGRRMTCLVISIASLFAPAARFCYGDEDNWITEPQQTLHLSIGSQSYKIETSKPTTIAIDGQEKSVTLNSDRYRTFKTDCFSFEYPSTFRYRKEKIEPGEDKIHYCRLDGDDIIVRIAEQTPKLDFTSFAAYFREKLSKFGEGMLVTEKREEFKTANSTLDEMTFNLRGTVLDKPFQQTNRCFLIPSANKETCVVLVASTLSVPPSEEAADFIATLGKTLVMTSSK